MSVIGGTVSQRVGYDEVTREFFDPSTGAPIDNNQGRALASAEMGEGFIVVGINDVVGDEGDSLRLNDTPASSAPNMWPLVGVALLIWWATK